MYTDRDTTGIKPDHGLTLTPCIMNPKARGDVRLSSSNPLDLPLVNPNFLSQSSTSWDLIFVSLLTFSFLFAANILLRNREYHVGETL